MKTPYYTPGPWVSARGNPDGRTLSGQINEVVHLRVPASRDGCHDAKPACGNGAFNLWWSSHLTSVTCPACRAKSTGEKAAVREESLWSALVAAGVPIASHESDMYFQASAVSRGILNHFPEQKQNAKTFVNQAAPHKGELWFDVPFAFLPWWEARKSTEGGK